MKPVRPIAFIAAFVLCLPVHAAADDFKSLVQEQLRAPMQLSASVPYSYLVTIDVDSREGKNKSESFYGQYRFNPAAAAGERVSLIDLTWDEVPKDMRKELEKDNVEGSEADFAEDFWCTNDQKDLEVMASDSVTVIREDETEAVVSLGPDAIAYFLADDSEKEGRGLPKKIRKRMLSELTFSKPDLYLTHSRVWLSKPTTLKIVAKMKEMDFKMGCALAPNGLPFVSQSNTVIVGKALGTGFQARVDISISDLQPVKSNP